jgi:alpha-ketoglutarate-dependent taurine dioxygenase
MLTICQIHTNPASGGDTLWASAYEAYSRISPPIAQLLEGLNAVHDAHWFKQAARGFGFDMRTGERGSPLNKGDELQAIHPVIRVSE